MAAAAADIDAAAATKKRKLWHNTQYLLQTSSSLPNDIIVEILSWVPAKALLLRLKWTCKYWFHLITKDPDFVKLHVHHSNSTNFHSPSILISNPPILIDDIKWLHVSSRTCKFFQCYIDSTTGFFSPRVRTSFTFTSKICVDFRMLGSCHGLLFFSCNSPSTNGNGGMETLYYIWNPCTKEYRELPDPGRFSGIRIFGFGYDSSIDDYKVIINEYAPLMVHCCSVLVYTLGTNSWRSSSTRPFTSNISCPGFGNGVFVNGALYFIHFKVQYYSDTKILCFDIEKETFEEISVQPEWLHDGLKAVTLEVFEGSLCLVLSTNYEVDIWMMKKDYSNNEEPSWTKLFKIRRHVFCGGYRNNLNPLRLKNGEIMIFDRPELYRLHWKEQVQAVYIDSLVSLNSGTYTVDEQLNTLSDGFVLD